MKNKSINFDGTSRQIYNGLELASISTSYLIKPYDAKCIIIGFDYDVQRAFFVINNNSFVVFI